MERLQFLKRLGLGIGVSIIAPSTFIKQENTKFINSDSLKLPDHHQSICTNNKPIIPHDKPWEIKVSNNSSGWVPDFMLFGDTGPAGPTF